MAYLSVENLSVVYPNGTHALEGVSTGFERGRFTVLLGRSGAGKSTLLRSLNRLVEPTSGHVKLEDGSETLADADVHALRRRTGMIFQQHQLIGRQSALKNVLIGRLGFHPAWRSLFPLPENETRLALDCLDRVGLLSKALQRADKLSGGEQQRVGIARALCQQPELLLADEPVASLDPASADSVLELLRRICREDGLTAIVSLHQVGLAKKFGDRIVGLHAGKLLWERTPEQLSTADLSSLYAVGGNASSGTAGDVDGEIWEE